MFAGAVEKRDRATTKTLYWLILKNVISAHNGMNTAIVEKGFWILSRDIKGVMMKYFSSSKILQYLSLILMIFVFISCASNAKYITKSSQYTSYGIDYHDIEKMVDDNVKSFLKSDFIKDLTRENFGNKKVLAISDIQNTTNENVDVELLSRKFVRKIRNFKKFTLTNAISGSGNTTDSMIKNSRKLRNDEEFNQLTTQQKNNLISPDYSLSGKISQRVTPIRKDLRIDYQFLLTLTDLKTGTVVWDNEKVISKLVTRDEIEQMAEQEHIAKPYSYNKRQSSKTKYYPTTKNHFIFGVDFAANGGQWNLNGERESDDYYFPIRFHGFGVNFMLPMNFIVGYERDIGENWALGTNIVYTHIFTPTESTYNSRGYKTTVDFIIHRLGLEFLGIYKDKTYNIDLYAKVRFSRDFTLLGSSMMIDSFEIPLENSYVSMGLGFVWYTDSRKVGFFWEIISYETILQRQFFSDPNYTPNYVMARYGTALGLRFRF